MSKQNSMINRPDVSDFALVSLPGGVGKVIYQPDQRHPLCGTFHLAGEDHTLGNLVKIELLKNPHVKFAGYRQPHPLERRIELRVQTEDDTTPIRAMEESIYQLRATMMNFSDKFSDSVASYRATSGSGGLGQQGGGLWEQNNNSGGYYQQRGGDGVGGSTDGILHRSRGGRVGGYIDTV
eukprot:GHVS01091785.1.p1 GENE.GHVS01091785.1~~GHVS01091785.1.p1  ORF type:complete len:180 (+),score=22.25 GHVS01091785.1:164-703(+)